MADAVISVGAEMAAQHVVDSVSTKLSYIWNYQTNFQNLEEQLQNLKLKRDMVQHKIDEAKRNGDEIEQLAQQWMDKVNKTIDEATDIINKRVSMRCFRSMCPNVKNRYQRSKEALMKREEVSELYNEGTFTSVSYRTLPSETWLADGYENIKSRQDIFLGILDALSDRDVNMIGVHGMGGCGKTTLVRAVAKQAEEDKIFDKVVFAEVSETVDIRKIQVLIAERLGLDFRESSERVRADRLRDRIMQEKKILIILDNIWEDLDLWALGIPFGDNHVGCQLLLTSRDADLLRKMDSQTNFAVEILEEEEAHNLFMKIAGVGEDQRDLRSLAIEVAKECGGLLVAIITIAKALRKKKEAENWRTALRELRDPPLFDVKGSVLKKAYTCINLSYEKLESEQQKSIFLLCSIMGRTHYAPTEELLRYAVGLGFFKKEKTMEDARDKVKILVRKLKDSSLLLDTSYPETFSIHDVVHDVGRWIASTQNKFTVINDDIPRYWTTENTLERCTSITLHDIVELPRSLECPQLKFFCMKIKTRFTKIPTDFFKQMPNLEVLHLIGMDLSPLPASIRLLKSLRTLILYWCRLEDIAEIKDMENLEILVVDLNDNIKQLPEEIGQLTSLRLLDLRNHSFVISHKTISRLSNLEELYMGYWHHQRWVEDLNIEKGAASQEELKVLPLLTALHISVEAAEVLPKGLVFEKLRRYKIIIGNHMWMYKNRGGNLRTLKVRSDTNICSEDGLMKQLKGFEELLLDGKQRVKNALCELDGEGFPTLKHFDIRNNPCIQLIVDSMSSATCEAFPLLETLSLSNLVRLEKICHDQLKNKCFCQLRTIKVDNCHKLKNLFPLSIAKHVSQLQEIEVVDCENMEEIFIVDRADNGVIDPLIFNQLHSLILKSLSRLRRIYSVADVALTSQERQMPLTTETSSSEIILKDQLDAMPFLGEKVIFPNLKYLTLHDITLQYLFSSSTLGSFKQLQHLEINGCKDLEELIRIDDKCSNYVEFSSLEKLQIEYCPELRKFIFSVKVSFPNLREINIRGMKSLKMIWQSQVNQSVQYCPNLCKVSFYDCQSLENIFPASIAGSLLQLEELEVKSCGIKEIVAKEEKGEEAAAGFAFPQLTTLYLHSLGKLRCFYPGKHTTEWPKLNRLGVENCGKIGLFSFQDIDDVCAVPQPLFLVNQAFLNLEEVIINMNHIKMICQSSFLEHFFLKLKSLVIEDDQWSIYPLSKSHKFNNLVELKLRSRFHEEIFLYEEAWKHVGMFSQLKSLHLLSLGRLKQIWKQDSKMDLIIQKLEILRVSSCDNLINLMLPSTSFKNLKILEVEFCSRLTSLIPVSTIEGLLQLEEMSITYCEEMTNIIANEGDVMEGQIIVSKLKSLTLQGLTNLRSFYSGNCTFNFPLLEKVMVNICPKLKFFSSGVLITPHLQEVQQEQTNYKCEHGDLNTTLKQIHDKKVFSILLQQSILEGKDLRLFWNLFPECMKTFSNTKQLHLSGDDIAMIWQSQFPGHIFPELECLHVSNDKSSSFPLEIFHKLHNVEKLELKYCTYEEIFLHEEVEKYASALAQIKCLHLCHLFDAKQMWKKDAKHDLLLWNLEILKVEFCGSLVDALLPSSSFKNLKIMKVVSCERLISLLAASTAKSLVQLEEMQISDCKMMIEVVAKQGDAWGYEIIFLKLKKLELNNLSSLTSFSFGNCTFKFPFLEKLNMEECPNLKIFSSGDLSMPLLQEVWQDYERYYICQNDLNKIVQQHNEEMVFSRKELSFESIRTILQKFPEHQKVFFNVEQLSLSRDDIGMHWQIQLPQHLFPKLKLLEVFEDESKVFPLATLKRFHNLEKLELKCGSYEELFSCGDVEKHAEALTQIKSLSLYGLYNLKQMWKQDTHMDLILQNLEFLEVNWCCSLVSLVPHSSSFQNLTFLTVGDCDGLMSLVAPATAKSLVQLKKLTIRKCKMMTEVISSNEEAAIEDEIIFSKLWILDLDGLSSLTSFCSGNYTFNFPCLSCLNLKNCPKMKFFSFGVLNTPELRKILYESTEYFCDDGLNATIQEIHEKPNAKAYPDDLAGPSTAFSYSASSSAT